MRKKLFFTTMLLTMSLASFSFSLDQSSKKLTVESMFDKELQESMSTPQYIWLNNGKILLLDLRVKEEKRTLECFDPGTGRSSSFLDRNKVLASLEKICGDKTLQSIRWPDAIDPNGKAVVYVVDGDLFCIETLHSNIKQLTKTSEPETSVTFAPDGNWVSFIRNNDIYAIDWRKGLEKRLTTGATETLLNGPLSWVYWEEIYGHTPVPYRWSPDSKAIAYLQTDDSPVSVSTFVNFQPATQGVIRQRYPKAGQNNPKVRLGLVEFSDAKTTWMDCGKYEYIARFNWLPDSREIAAQTLNRRQSELRLMLADRKTGKSHEILIDRQDAWINLSDSLHFLKDGKRFIWLSERDGYRHFYLYGKEGRLIRQLTKGKFMVVPKNGALVGIDENSEWIYFTSNKHALKEKHLYRIKLDGTGLERMSTERGVHTISFSPCMKYFLNTHSNLEISPEFSLYKANGSKITTITSSAKNIFKSLYPTYPEFHEFEADGGLMLPVMMTKPNDFDPQKKYPAIVYVYGGPGSQQVVDGWRGAWWLWWRLWPSLLNQEGFITYVLEVRAGMEKSKALETSVYKQAYGMQNVKDILAGVRWIKQMPFIDPERIGLWGWSGGGCTTLYTMTHSDVFKAAIAVAPVSDWHFYDTIYTERYQNTPQDNPEGYKDTSSVLAASNLKGHLLIIHGSYDDNVHPQNTYAFIDKLISHGIEFEMMIYPWRKHGIRDAPARVHHFNLMLDFWKKNLK